ncbi:MAG: PAC2 family protein [bacterium]
MKKHDMITVHEQINIRNVTFISAWPGMGNVALGAVDYLRRMTGAKLFAEIDLGYLFSPDAIVVNNGVVELPELPKNFFYYLTDPPIIFFESDVQLSGIGAMNLLDKILGFISEFSIKKVYTGAAYSLPITHHAESELYGVVSKDKLKDYIKEYNIQIMNEGQISGMNGLILGYATKRKLESICLLATMPLYAVNLPNPKASKAIVSKLAQMLSLDVDMFEIDAAIEEMNKKMDALEENIKELFPGITSDEQQGDSPDKLPTDQPIEKDNIPSHVLDKIEKLFKEAQSDKKKAYMLKAELDRWNLYKLYEDRFLNLFKEKQ